MTPINARTISKNRDILIEKQVILYLSPERFLSGEAFDKGQIQPEPCMLWAVTLQLQAVATKSTDYA